MLHYNQVSSPMKLLIIFWNCYRYRSLRIVYFLNCYRYRSYTECVFSETVTVIVAYGMCIFQSTEIFHWRNRIACINNRSIGISDQYNNVSFNEHYDLLQILNHICIVELKNIVHQTLHKRVGSLNLLPRCVAMLENTNILLHLQNLRIGPSLVTWKSRTCT